MHPDSDIDNFHYDARTASLALAIIGLLLALSVLAVISGQTDTTWDLVAGLFAIVFLVVLLGVFLYVAKHQPVTLKVGPNGIDVPFAFKKPLAWHDIERIERKPTIGFWQKREWLKIFPLPDVLPDYRLKSPRKLELWYLRRAGVQLPLHGIKGSSNDIIASIERFHPVQTS